MVELLKLTMFSVVSIIVISVKEQFLNKHYFDKLTMSDLEYILLSENDNRKCTILAINEDEDTLALLNKTLRCDYNLLLAASAKEAIDLIDVHGDKIALIIAEQKMQVMDVDLFEVVSKSHPDIVKIVLAEHSNLEVLVDLINESHIFQYIIKPFDAKQLCTIVANGIKKYNLTTSKMELLNDLSELFYRTIKSIASALDAKDKYTHGHSLRVTLYSLALARALNLPDKMLEEIETTGLLHDIGKIAIPEKILLKPGKLTAEEYSIIKLHPEMGEKLVYSIEKLKIISNWLKSHHERYDGTGYPEKLAGEEIPLSSRIIAIADTYDAMTSNRSYKKELSHEVALKEIGRCAGTQFDPKLVELFVSISDEILVLKEDSEAAYPKYSYLDKLIKPIEVEANYRSLTVSP